MIIKTYTLVIENGLDRDQGVEVLIRREVEDPEAEKRPNLVIKEADQEIEIKIVTEIDFDAPEVEAKNVSEITIGKGNLKINFFIIWKFFF